MFSCNSLRGLALGISLLTAACGSAAQDLSVQFHADASSMIPRAQVQTVPSRRIGADAPARILVIGDSLAQGIGIFLDRRVKERGLAAVVTNAGRTSTGLARSDFYDWPEKFDAIAAEARPDIVIAHFGTNDNQGVSRTEGRTPLGSAGWEDAYRDQSRKILEVAARHKTVVYWLGPAPDRSASLNAHLSRINPIFRTESKLTNARYLPLSEFAADASGAYATSTIIDGQAVTIRSGDGSHFTGNGYYLIADKVLADMQSRIPGIFAAPQIELAGVLQ